MKKERCYFFVVLLVCAKLVNASCPSTCSCSNSTSGFYVNCYSKSFESIPDLPNDTYNLNFAYNSIHDIDVKFCEKMPLLQTIYIYNNLIEEITNETFANCHQLITLDIDDNKLKSIAKMDFSSLRQLRTLDLSGNAIEYMHPEAFRNLTSLKTLDLRSNAIEFIHPEAFHNLTSLEKLDLSNNAIEYVHPEAFRDLTLLENLDLSSNEIEAINPEVFRNLTSLERLDLGSNKIHNIEENTLRHLPNLRYLFMEENNISSINSISFQEMPNLYYLYLQNNRITDIPRDTFYNLSQLYRLYLFNNKIQFIQSYTFVNMTNLYNLDRLLSATITARQTPGMHNPRISAQTVRNRLREAGDESRFRLRRSDGRMRVYRRQNERYADACVHECDRFGGGGGGMMDNGRCHVVRVRRRHQPPESVNQLRAALMEEWNNISQAFIQRLIGSMRRRLTAVINARGGHTRY
ncbi:Hypothetical predicted protein [Mytilus galloprovincialis]|uniref:Uncharacterized protein n=1 Tax=Mytilus galloprovincialis TaxID=29158 RepID=A0A8B6GDJ5_MYTGA|nr:Hypothetical predicted protein [Mytilus galloprovincialis]